MNVMTVNPGDIIAQKFRVERILGSGAMGVVFAATHLDLQQLVAVKYMLTGKGANADRRQRFLREARGTVRLKSHHVARVLDVGADYEAPYIVMEFLEGKDLAAVLAEHSRLRFEDAVEYVLQVCEAVAEAHAAGIVHRDLKPANLFLTYDVSGAPCVKVLDFGISKFADAGLALTNDTQSLGSPLYMSPEQMSSSKSVDHRSDIWALGVVLYELVAGQTPFHAESIHELCSRVLMGRPTPLTQHRPDAPPGFEAVLLKCFEQDRDRRWPNVAAFAAAIAPYAPPHARVYADRVARIANARAPRAGSAPDLPPLPPLVHAPPSATVGLPPQPPPLVGVFPAEAAQSPEMLNATMPPATQRLPELAPTEAPNLEPITLEMVAAPKPVGSETGLTLSASQNKTSAPASMQPAQSKTLKVVALGGFAALILFGIVAMAIQTRQTDVEPIVITVPPIASPAPAAAPEVVASIAVPMPSAVAAAAPVEATPVAAPSASAQAVSRPSITGAPVVQRPAKAPPAPTKKKPLYTR